MDIEFFTAEDFQQYAPDRGGIFAFAANRKLEKEGKVVYGCLLPQSMGCEGFDWQEQKDSFKTKKALLINIEPIQECEHPAEKVTSILIRESFQKESDSLIPIHKGEFYRCECGAKVEPKTFKEI